MTVATPVSDVSTALLSAAGWIEPPRVAPPTVAWLELRDTASAIRLAVQILRGPYAVLGKGEMQARALEVLQSLESSTRRLCDLVATVQPPANDAGPPPPVAPVESRTTVVAPLAAVVTPAAGAVRPRPAAGPRSVDVTELLAKLEVVVGTRAAAPLVLSVAAPSQLSVALDGAELLRTLVLMVEDVAPTDGNADVRVFLDPTEELGDAIDVVFEVRARAGAAAPTASAALCAAIEGLGGRLVVRRTSTTSALALRLAHGG